MCISVTISIYIKKLINNSLLKIIIHLRQSLISAFSTDRLSNKILFFGQLTVRVRLPDLTDKIAGFDLSIFPIVHLY